jgi:hypothetical protein
MRLKAENPPRSERVGRRETDSISESSLGTRPLGAAQTAAAQTHRGSVVQIQQNPDLVGYRQRLGQPAVLQK